MPFNPDKLGQAIRTRFEIIESGCWQWLNKKTSVNGYGRIKRYGKYILTHKYFYSKYIGKVPEGLILDHLCKNRMCVNPAHLEPVTYAENTRRGKGTYLLTIEQVREIRKLAILIKTKSEKESLAKQYKIPVSYLYKIVNLDVWKEQDNNNQTSV